MSNLEKEVAYLREQLANLLMEQKLMAAQLAKTVEMVADSKNAVIIAQHAQAMASEALIKATTGKTMDEALGIDIGSPSRDNIVSMEEKRNSRMSYFDDLIGEVPDLKGE
jgi:hypothetical protein